LDAEREGDQLEASAIADEGRSEGERRVGDRAEEVRTEAGQAETVVVNELFRGVGEEPSDGASVEEVETPGAAGRFGGQVAPLLRQEGRVDREE
jgi:hypothetical protein